ncbi:helix-turn-helix domain-containing protein [Flavobacterium sp.]|uniref:helix-turn-helix domain-containing protein n=1 Tax=Flavobacterium sp. TaxID=239 RepID=UPI002486D75B|nr:helix-turn-helix domain-containing protein [Flavobacterium sp.]MDI1318105.1 helix-turn-helix domain-containing protein [Flavobacterium sp.]
MKLVITTPEMLEDIVRSSPDSAIQEFYSKKELAKTKKKHYTIKETALELKVSTLTVRNYIDRGILKAFKIGNRILITNESLEKAMNEVKSSRYKR